MDRSPSSANFTKKIQCFQYVFQLVVYFFVFLYLIMLSCLDLLVQLTWLVRLVLALLCLALLVWLFASMFAFRARTYDPVCGARERLVLLV